MDKKVDPNQIFKKEQIFEEVIQRMLTKEDWSTEEKILHLRRLDNRLKANKQPTAGDVQAGESPSSLAR